MKAATHATIDNVQLLFSGRFSKTLSTGVVHVLFKGGDASEFDNYMGITVEPILAKLFTMILDKRLSMWAEQHGLRAKG
jgi:hypothetical protein